MRTEVRAILLGDRPVSSFEEYKRAGGGQAFEKARSSSPEEMIALIRRAGLRGRGGAGFPTAMKWEGIRASPALAKYICCNGAEGEPGTFKDRYLLRNNPYQVLEGLAIGARAIGAAAAYICVKEKFGQEVERLQTALQELQAEWPDARNIELVSGPDEYLYGEEKALLEVIEGGLPLPRVFPPRIHGLFGGAYGGPSELESNPTVVNNVETLSHVRHIINRGPEWFRSFGTDETPGTMVFTVSGDVQRPLVRELPLGTTLREVLFQVAGGPPPGRQVKAVFPGLAGSVITEPLFDVPLGFDSMRKAGSALGSAGFIVYDDSACMVAVAQALCRFLHIESCNQCPPCKMASRQILELLDRLLEGDPGPGDVDGILDGTTWVENAQRCALPTSTRLVASSVVDAFPDDFSRHLSNSCRLRHDIVMPKITDYVEGKGFQYDLEYVRKQPDWSYE